MVCGKEVVGWETIPQIQRHTNEALKLGLDSSRPDVAPIIPSLVWYFLIKTEHSRRYLALPVVTVGVSKNGDRIYLVLSGGGGLKNAN